MFLFIFLLSCQRNENELRSAACRGIGAGSTCNVGSIGDNICTKCGAMLFNGECTPTSKYGKFSLCCSNGNVVLPDFQEAPAALWELLEARGNRLDKYLTRSRQFNNAFSYASFKCHSFTLPGAIADMRIQGSAYIATGGIRADDQNNPRFIQHFFTSADEISMFENIVRDTHLPSDSTTQELLQIIRRTLQNTEVSPIWGAYATADQLLSSMPTNMRLIFSTDKEIISGHTRTYNLPETGSRVLNAEVGAIVDDMNNAIESGYNRDIVIRHVGGPTMSLPTNHRMVDPLTYPLLFPRGDDGWGLMIYPLLAKKGKRTHVSAHEYMKFRIQHRKRRRGDYHLMHGRLTQQWIISNFLKIEADRLSFLRSQAGQKKIRADMYKEVQEARRLNRLGQTGRHIILPSTYKGSPRNMIQLYGDAMAIVRDLSRPHFFLTMTCNTQWEEIQSALPPGRQAHHCPWISVRVFAQKFKCLCDDVLKNGVLGKVIGYTWMIEFQKRGLPHAHMLIILDDDDVSRSPEEYDNIVCAELCDASTLRTARRKLTSL